MKAWPLDYVFIIIFFYQPAKKNALEDEVFFLDIFYIKGCYAKKI